LTKEVSEIRDGIAAVSYELLLSLLAIVFFPVNVGQDGRNLTICKYYQYFLLTLPTCISYIPPSSLAITSALSSMVVYAMELFEFPNEIPIACRSAGDDPSAAILSAWKCGRIERKSGE
jgi:hypothetical protein